MLYFHLKSPYWRSVVALVGLLNLDFLKLLFLVALISCFLNTVFLKQEKTKKKCDEKSDVCDVETIMIQPDSLILPDLLLKM